MKAAIDQLDKLVKLKAWDPRDPDETRAEHMPDPEEGLGEAIQQQLENWSVQELLEYAAGLHDMGQKDFLIWLIGEVVLEDETEKQNWKENLSTPRDYEPRR